MWRSENQWYSGEANFGFLNGSFKLSSVKNHSCFGLHTDLKVQSILLVWYVTGPLLPQPFYFSGFCCSQFLSLTGA
eukprot:c14965_g1_i1 orf=180-407(-)